MVKIFIEGAAKGDLSTECRQNFKAFFAKANIDMKKIDPIACGPRGIAFKRFRRSWEKRKECYLLVDSERPISDPREVWTLLSDSRNDNWPKPSGSEDRHCHLMVECMENWILSDANAVKDYYGQNFNSNLMPRRTNLETVSKQETKSKLEMATRDTTKGKYSKGAHSFKLIGLISPSIVESKCGFCRRLFNELRNL
ncbi:MAG: DUF4276 family protein [Victivallaceae bacterium]|nr:DUF4276 family protein [Victivallaceae bacterium]